MSTSATPHSWARPKGMGSDERSQVLVVNGHPVLREGLLALVEREADITVCGMAADADAALLAVQEHDPRVVVIDVSQSESNGIEHARAGFLRHTPSCVSCASRCTPTGTCCRRCSRPGPPVTCSGAPNPTKC